MNREFFYYEMNQDHRRDVENALRDARLLAKADRVRTPLPKWSPVVLRLATQAMIAAALLRLGHFFS